MSTQKTKLQKYLENRNKGSWLVILFIILLIVGGGASFYYSQGDTNRTPVEQTTPADSAAQPTGQPPSDAQ